MTGTSFRRQRTSGESQRKIGLTKRARRMLLLSAATAVGGLLTGPPAFAQSTDTWVGGVSGNWADANWTGTDNPPLSGDSLVFGPTAGTTSLNDNLTSSAFTLGGITFNAGGASYTIGGNAFALGGNITNGFTGSESFGDAITLAGTAGTTQTIVNTNNGTMILSGVISGASTLLVQNSIGTVPFGATILSGSNTYTGGTILTYGTLDINNATALGTGPLTISGNTTSFDNTSGAPITLTNNNAITFTGASGSSYNFIGSNTLNLGTGPVTFNTSHLFNVNSSTLIIGGAISQSATAGLTLQGLGTLDLSGANTFTGTVQLEGAPLPAVSSANNYIYGNAYMGDAELLLDFSAPGAPTSNILDANSLTLAGGNVVIKSGNSGTVSQTFATVTLDGGYNTFQSLGSNAINVKFGTFTSSFESKDGLVNFVIGPNTTYAVTNGSDESLTFAPSANQSAYIATQNGTMSWATLTTGTNAGTIAALPTSSYVSPTGTASFTSANNIDMSGVPTLTFAASAAAFSLRYNNPQATTITMGPTTTATSVLTIEGGGILMTPAVGANNELITGGQIRGNSNRALRIINFDPQGTLTIASNITDNVGTGSNSVNIFGNGDVILSGTNTYDAETMVVGATLSVYSNLNLGVVSINSTTGQTSAPGNNGGTWNTTANNSVNLDGGVLQALATFAMNNDANNTSGTSDRQIGLGANGGTLDVTSGNTLTVSGAITGAGLEQIDSGTLVLSCPTNSYTGVTTLSGGLLNAAVISNGGTLSSIGAATNVASNLVIDGGDLQYTGSTSQSTDHLFTIGGPLGETATLDASGSSGATLAFTNPGAIAFGDSNPHTLILTGSGSGSLAASIGDANPSTGQTSLSKTGSGVWTLNGNGTYSGPTNITGGQLDIGSGVSLGNTTVTVGNGAAFDLLGNTTIGSGNASITVNGGASLEMNSSISTLTVNGASNATGLAIGGTPESVLDFMINSVGNSDLIALGQSNLALDGSVLVNISGNQTLGTYTLMTFNNSISQSLLNSDFSLGAHPPGNNSFSFLVGPGGDSIDLVVGGSVPLPTAYWTGAQSSNWNSLTGVAGSSNWSASNTGTPDGFNVPTAPTNVVFSASNGNRNLNTTLGADFAINSLTFASGVGGVTIGGANILTVGTGGISVQNSSTDTISAMGDGSFGSIGLFLGAAQTWTTSSGSSLAVTAVVGGTGALTVSGSGTIALFASNTYSAGTTVSSGDLQLNNPKALGSGNLIVNGGTVDLNGTAVVTGVLSGAGGIITNTNGNAATLTIGGSSTGTFAGSINDDGQVNLVVEGTGKEIFTGNSDYSGQTTINLGSTLQLGNGTSNGSIGNGSVTDNGTLAFANASAESFGNNINGSGVLTMSGPGTLTLTNGNNYSGGTTITGGTLQLGNSSALGSGPLTITAGTLDLDGQNVSLSALSGAGTIDNSAGGTPQLTFNVSGVSTFAGSIKNSTGSVQVQNNGSGTQILTGVSTYSGGTTFNTGVLGISNDAAINYGIGGLTFNGGALQLDNYVSTLTFNNISNFTLGAAAGAQASLSSGALAGSTTLTYIGPGTLVLNGANTYTGGTNVNGGILSISSDAAVNNGNGTINFGTNGTFGTLLLNNYTSNLTFGNGAQLGATGTVTLAGQITGGNLTYEGPGTLILKAANSYSNTTIAAGTLQLANANALGNNNGNVTVTTGLLNLNGFSANIGDLAGAGTVDNVAGGGTTSLTLNTNGSATFTGTLKNTTGSIGLIVTGGGTEVFTGTNTYTGGTTLQGGALAVSSDKAINFGLGGFTFSGGELQLDNYASTFTFKNISNLQLGANTGTASSLVSGALSGSTALTFNGPGTLNLLGTNTFTGQLDINNGTLGVASDGGVDFGIGGIQFNNTGVLQFQNYSSTLSFANGAQLAAVAGTSTLAGAISGGNQLLYGGPGTLVLTASNSYSGGTTISGGLLRVGNVSALGSNNTSNPVTFTGPGELDLNGFNMSIGGLASTVSTAIVDSTGTPPVTLTINGSNTNTYAGIIQNSKGSLSLVIAQGNQVLSGNSTFSGGVTVLPGAIVTVGGSGTPLGAQLNTVNIESGGELDFGTSDQLSENNYVITVAGQGTNGDGAIHFTGASARLGDPNGNLTGASITIADGTWIGADGGTPTTGNLLGGFGGGGPDGWTKVGAGTLELEGTAPYTYTGPTTVASGYLISHETGGPNPTTILGNLIIDNDADFQDDQNGNPYNTITVITVNTGGILDLDSHGNTNFTSTAASLNGGGLITASGSAGAATVASGTLILSAAADTFSGTIEDDSNNGFVAFGVTGGTEILTGPNTYSAGTIIGTAGTVQVDDGGTTGTVGVGPVFDNGNLVLDRGDADYTFSNVVSGSGAVSMISSGTTILTGSNSYTGGTIVNAGVLQLGNANAAGAGGPLTVNGGTFDLSGFSESFAALSGTGGVVDNVSAGGNLTLTIGSGNVNSAYAGAIKDTTGSINLVKVGTGTQTLSGANTYTGPTSAQGGELIIASATALPAGNKLSISSGAAVQFATVGNTFDLTGLVINSGGTLDVTANAVTLSYSSSDPVASIQSALAAGYSSAWAGPGIISSTVASLNAGQSALIYDVGYADGKDGITGVPSGEIEILPTLAGDAKMQGNVVFGDFQLLSQYFGQANTSWDEGDFTYNGTTNFGDFQLLSQNFGQSASALTSGELASINSFAAQFGQTMESNGTGYSLVSVPEPATAGLLAAAGFGLLARRRRRGAK